MSTNAKPKKDPTNPDHYAGQVQPIDFIMANEIGFCEGNVVKYVSRWKKKNGLEDLLKAQQYLEFLINHVKEGRPRT